MIETSMQFVVFKVGQELFGIRIDEVREIIRSIKATQMPDSYGWIEGVVELRGKVIPVIDLRNYFSLAKDEGEQKRTVVVEMNEELVGFNVDSVEGIVEVSSQHVETAPQSVTKPYIKGLVRDNGKLIIILEPESLFYSKEVTNSGF